MSADIQRLENAARLSMGTFQELDTAPARGVSALSAAAVFAAIAVPCLALFLYL